MRRTLTVLALIGALGSAVLTAGCEAKAAADPGPQWPAAAAGRLCPLLDYDAVEAQLGVRFDTAGGGRQDDTLTCAVTQAAHPFPYLTVAATGSNADELIFRATIVPGGSAPVAGLGVIAYQLVRAPAGGSGPGLEISWLSASKRLVLLRFVFGPEATDADVTAMGPKLLALAQAADKTLSSTAVDLTS